MKFSGLFKAMLVMACCATLTVRAEEEPDWLKVDENDVQTPPSTAVGHEAEAGFSYAADANIRQGDRSLGDLDSMDSYVTYRAIFPLSDRVHGRVGFDWDRESFGLPAATPLPNTLQQTALSIGFDVELADQWVMRVEAAPGIYSDFQDISFTDFNIPVILGFSYIVDSRLQWVFGISADFRREIPVLPGVGVRWQFADDWTLNFILPKPRLEYQVDPAVVLYLGGEVKTGTYAVSKKIGDPVGRPNLDNEIIEYTEARSGVGLTYKMSPSVSLNLEVGGVFYRRFSYEDDHLDIHSSEPALYGGVGLKATF